MTGAAAARYRREATPWLLGGALALALHAAAGLYLSGMRVAAPGADRPAVISFELEPLMVEAVEPAAPAAHPSLPAPAPIEPAAEPGQAIQPAPADEADTVRPSPTREVVEALPAAGATLEVDDLAPPEAVKATPPAQPDVETVQPVEDEPETVAVPQPERLDGVPPLLQDEEQAQDPVLPEETEPPARRPIPRGTPKNAAKSVQTERRPARARPATSRPEPAAPRKTEAAEVERRHARKMETSPAGDRKAGSQKAGADRPSRAAGRATAGGNAASGGAGRPLLSPARWQAAVNAHIRRFRQYPRGASGSAPVRVQFQINARGVVRSVSVASSSGDPALDRAAVDTVRRASPVPAPPPEIASSSMRLGITINFKR